MDKDNDGSTLCVKYLPVLYKYHLEVQLSIPWFLSF